MKKAKPNKSQNGKAILRRIDAAIADIRKGPNDPSDREISLRATGKPWRLASIRKGLKNGSQTGISADSLRGFARVLNKSAEYLLNGDGREDVEPIVDFHLDSAHVMSDPRPAPSVPLVRYVSAGAQAVLIHLPAGELDRVPAPPHYNDNTRALEVRGDSLGALFDRWLVFYDDVRSPITPDLINKLCIIGLADGRILIKKVRRNRDGGYDLLSNTEEPITGIVIEWAALVKSMEPR